MAAGLATFGNAAAVRDGGGQAISKKVIEKAQQAILQIIQHGIDDARVSRDPVTVILVGGGAILVPLDVTLPGVERVIVPESAGVANAIGACIAQVSGTVDRIVTGVDSDAAKAEARKEAAAAAVNAGAVADSVVMTELEVIPIAYIPGGAMRVCAKAVGDLDLERLASGAVAEGENITGGENRNVVEAKTHLSDAVPPPGATQGGAANMRTKPNFGRAMEEAKARLAHVQGWEVTERDVECIAIGGGLLGSGGGGSCMLARLRLLAAMRSGAKPRIIAPEDVPEESMVVPLALMGAPAVAREMVPSDTELAAAAAAVADVLDKAGKQVRLWDRRASVTLSVVGHGTVCRQMKKQSKRKSQSPQVLQFIALAPPTPCYLPTNFTPSPQ